MVFFLMLALALAGNESSRLIERDWTRFVLEGLQQARAQAGAANFRREEALDAVAGARARQIAGLPHSRRLSAGAVETFLRDAGVEEFHAAREHIDLRRGYPDVGRAVLSDWSATDGAWVEAMSPKWDSIGLASHRADDGWVVFVAVLLDENEFRPRELDPGDLRKLERDVLDEINSIRERRGKVGLANDAELSTVARSHSRDMARRDFFDHRTPEGGRPRDRVAARGIGFRRLGENIQMSRGMDDPVAAAVRGWMESTAHRRTLLQAEYTTTGVGVAVADDGSIFFTQLFMTPAAR